MNSRAEFWKKVDEHGGPGTLFLALLVSWKRVADEIGRGAVDIASAVFDVITEGALSPVGPTARLSTTVVGGYSARTDLEVATLPWFEHWLPMTITAHGVRIPIDVIRLSVTRSVGQSGSELYAEARRELDMRVMELPEVDRYPPLPLSWEEAVTP